MAQCVAEGVKEAGGQAQLLGPGEFSADRFSEFSAVAFGCSAMGAEQLEEAEFEPMFSSVEGVLGDVYKRQVQVFSMTSTVSLMCA